jgi:hypothetical protein
MNVRYIWINFSNAIMIWIKVFNQVLVEKSKSEIG